MKKMTKVLAMVILAMMMVAIVATPVMAANSTTGTTVKPTDLTGQSSVEVGGITNIGNSIVKILSTIGIVVSVIVLVVLGIKYMMGSAEEKAEYKKTLMPYVIGAALVFAASGIANIVYSFMQNAV